MPVAEKVTEAVGIQCLACLEVTSGVEDTSVHCPHCGQLNSLRTVRFERCPDWRNPRRCKSENHHWGRGDHVIGTSEWREGALDGPNVFPVRSFAIARIEFEVDAKDQAVAEGILRQALETSGLPYRVMDVRHYSKHVAPEELTAANAA
jgi:hypothetical protein